MENPFISLHRTFPIMVNLITDIRFERKLYSSNESSKVRVG